METKIIDVEYKGSPAKVTIKRLTFGETNEIQNQAVQIRLVGKIPQMSVDQKVMKEMSLVKSIVNAPFTINISSIRDIDNKLGEMLWREVNEFNDISPEKKPNYPGRTGMEAETQVPQEE